MTQIQRSLTKLVVLLVVAAGVGAYAWFGVHEAEKKAGEKKEAEAKAFDFDKAQVKRLVLEAQGGRVELEKDGDDWRITAPVTARADKWAAGAIVDKLADLKSREVLAEDRSDLAGFGLDAPSVRVRLGLADGRELLLVVGEENPFDNSLPYLRNDDPRVYLAESGLKLPLDKGLFDLREKALVTHEDREVQSLEVAVGATRWSVERQGENWRLTAPIQDGADRATVEGLLSRVRNARAKAFVHETAPDAAGLKALGLDKPKASLVFSLGADRARKTLQVGEAGGKVYARLAEGGPVMEVESAFASGLEKPLEEVRDKTVAAFDREQVRRLEISPADGETLVVSRGKEKKEGAAWESDVFTLVGRPESPKAWKLSSALYTLSSLKGVSIAEENAKSLAKYGLDKPQASWAVFGEGDAELARLLIGGEKGGRYFAAKAGSTRVYEVEKSTVDELPRRLADLVDSPAEGGSD